MRKCVSIVDMVIDEAVAALDDSLSLNNERVKEILGYCDDVEKIIVDFNCEAFSARVRMEEQPPTVVFEIETTYACAYSINHPYFNLIRNSKTFGVKWLNDDTICLWFEFDGVWERKIMNDEKRKKLKKAYEYLECAGNIVSEILDEEQDSIDNMPENLEGSERYEKMENAIDCLDSASSSIEDAMTQVNDSME